MCATKTFLLRSLSLNPSFGVCTNLDGAKSVSLKRTQLMFLAHQGIKELPKYLIEEIIKLQFHEKFFCGTRLICEEAY